jgi:hypothetical protein
MMKDALRVSILRLAALVLVVSSFPGAAAAGQFEIYGNFGVTFPFYSETFTYDPGPVSLPIPGLTIRQEGTFTLDAEGGTVYGFGAGYYFTSAVALEARVDFAGVEITTQGAQYHVSGGASYLPSFKFSARQTIALGVRELNAGEQQLEISTLPFAAIVQPEGEGQSRWGFNGGVILRIPFNEKVALVGDGRYFHFSEHTVTWARADNRPLNAIEQLLLAQVQQRLEPIRFRPQWFQVTGGLSITF